MPLDAARAEAIRQVHVQRAARARRARGAGAPARRRSPSIPGPCEAFLHLMRPGRHRDHHRAARDASASRPATRCVEAVERVLGARHAVVPLTDATAQPPRRRPSAPSWSAPTCRRRRIPVAESLRGARRASPTRPGSMVVGAGDRSRCAASIRPRSSARARSQEVHDLVETSARRRRRLRRSAHAGAAAQPREGARLQGDRPQRAHPRHLRAARAQPRGQAAGRAGAAPVPAAAPDARSGRTCRASAAAASARAAPARRSSRSTGGGCASASRMLRRRLGERRRAPAPAPRRAARRADSRPSRSSATPTPASRR